MNEAFIKAIEVCRISKTFSSIHSPWKSFYSYFVAVNYKDKAELFTVLHTKNINNKCAAPMAKF